MRRKRKTDILLVHADSVVSHTDQRLTAVLDLHRNCSGICIDRILRQFLHDCHRPLNDLACRDLIYGILIQNMYL